MSVRMKTPPTRGAEVVIKEDGEDVRFIVPRYQARGLLVLLHDYREDKKDDEDDWVDSEEVFADLHAKYTRPGSILRGARLKEDMSQIELAKRLGITQGDLSKMEHGKRPISVKMAKRLGKILNVGYQVFL